MDLQLVSLLMAIFRVWIRLADGLNFRSKYGIIFG